MDPVNETLSPELYLVFEGAAMDTVGKLTSKMVNVTEADDDRPASFDTTTTIVNSAEEYEAEISEVNKSDPLIEFVTAPESMNKGQLLP
jgi:hypothetical protein